MSDFGRVREVFDQVVDLPPTERLTALDRLCAGDPELRAQVESLLQANVQAASFMQKPAADIADISDLASAAGISADDGFRPGDRFGNFTLGELLGRGGMGVVYRAEQDMPRRTVAVKLLRAPLASPEMVRRFVQEAQVLARLRHPGISQIYEAGTAPGPRGTPQPYYAMELVHGKPLVTFANEEKLGTRQRLAIFALICDAVQHAHQKGIVHRDLKPANILVEPGHESSATSGPTSSSSAGPQPKILDFGVARITDHDLAVTTAGTHVGQLVGTLAYMSPEQVRGEVEHIDTRSDVYSLGVVLYELLTGRLPHDVRGRSIAAAAMTISGDEPTSPGRLLPELRGDIETILLKALEKAPARRYQSADELGADLRRFLSNLPIVARPATTTYQLRKFAQRNRGLVGGVIAAFILLLAGVVGTSIGLYRERVAREQAVIAARTSQQSADFLTQMLESVDPEEGTGIDTKVIDVLDKGVSGLSYFMGEPAVELQARLTLGTSYMNLGAHAKADEILQPGLALARRLAPNGSREEALVLTRLADIAAKRRQHQQGIELGLKAVEMTEAFCPDDPRQQSAAHAVLGVAYRIASRNADARDQLRQAVDLYSQLGKGEHPDTLLMLAGATSDAGGPGASDQARATYLAAIKAFRAGAKTEAALAGALHNFAGFLFRQREIAESEKCYREALAIRERVLPTDHPSTLGTRHTLCDVLTQKGSLDEAEALLTATLAARRRVLGENHLDVARSMTVLSGIKRRRGNLSEAEVLARGALEISQPQSAIESADAVRTLGHVLFAQKKLEEAEAAYRQSSEIRLREDPGSFATGLAVSDFSQILIGNQKYEEAENMSARAVAILLNVSPKSDTCAKAMFRHASALDLLGRKEEAEPEMRRSWELLKNDKAEATFRERFCKLLISLGKSEEAQRIQADAAAKGAAAPEKSAGKVEGEGK